MATYRLVTSSNGRTAIVDCNNIIYGTWSQRIVAEQVLYNMEHKND